jgi:hypothetical protein
MGGKIWPARSRSTRFWKTMVTSQSKFAGRRCGNLYRDGKIAHSRLARRPGPHGQFSWKANGGRLDFIFMHPTSNPLGAFARSIAARVRGTRFSCCRCGRHLPRNKAACQWPRAIALANPAGFALSARSLSPIHSITTSQIAARPLRAAGNRQGFAIRERLRAKLRATTSACRPNHAGNCAAGSMGIAACQRPGPPCAGARRAAEWPASAQHASTAPAHTRRSARAPGQRRRRVACATERQPSRWRDCLSFGRFRDWQWHSLARVAGPRR